MSSVNPTVSVLDQPNYTYSHAVKWVHVHVHVRDDVHYQYSAAKAKRSTDVPDAWAMSHPISRNLYPGAKYGVRTDQQSLRILFLIYCQYATVLYIHAMTCGYSA